MLTNIWLQALAAIAVPALLIAAVPRRWLKRAMLLWLVSPLIAYAGIIAWEMATRPPAPNPLGTAFYGLALIGGIVLIPWLIACMIGFGIGFGLRKLLRPPAAASAPPVPPPASPSWSPAPSPQPGWRKLHIGFANDGLRIDGLSVWDTKWHPSGGEKVTLPHPAYLEEMHHYDIYTITDERHQARFAACELSNGVWGFYIPVQPKVQPI